MKCGFFQNNSTKNNKISLTSLNTNYCNFNFLRNIFKVFTGNIKPTRKTHAVQWRLVEQKLARYAGHPICQGETKVCFLHC